MLFDKSKYIMYIYTYTHIYMHLFISFYKLNNPYFELVHISLYAVRTYNRHIVTNLPYVSIQQLYLSCTATKCKLTQPLIISL